jgi:hypothetical protein
MQKPATIFAALSASSQAILRWGPHSAVPALGSRLT